MLEDGGASIVHVIVISCYCLSTYFKNLCKIENSITYMSIPQHTQHMYTHTVPVHINVLQFGEALVDDALLYVASIDIHHPIYSTDDGIKIRTVLHRLVRAQDLQRRQQMIHDDQNICDSI